MLTIFATPKPFRSHIAVIQRNAIRSWTLLRPACEIILMGNDEGTAEIAAEFGLRYVPDIARNTFGDSSSERFVQTSSAIERQQPFLLREQRYYLHERLHAGDTAGCGPKKSFLTGWTSLELRCQGGIGIHIGLGRETSKSSEKICNISWRDLH